jgi:peptide/nickel transport system ATP-binding protein
MKERSLRPLRRRIQMVFQDPFSSLNPRERVADILIAGPRSFGEDPRAAKARAAEMLRLVGLNPETMHRLPHEFSGGQRQRIGLARALMLKPDVLIADEPVSALDVSVQATILELFASLRAELSLSILFIAHNLAVVQHLSDRVAVMYLGRIVELAETAEIFRNPRHPYTRALIDSIPRMSATSVNDAFELDGEPPSPYDIPSGCRFHPRCALASDICRQNDPPLIPVGPAGAEPHLSACLKADELAQIPLPDAPEELA